jgi:hypothetical protein
MRKKIGRALKWIEAALAALQDSPRLSTQVLSLSVSLSLSLSLSVSLSLSLSLSLCLSLSPYVSLCLRVVWSSTSLYVCICALCTAVVRVSL